MKDSPDPRVTSWVRAKVPEGLFATAITISEICYGFERLPPSRRRDDLAMAAEAVFGAFTDQVLRFDFDAARLCAELTAHRERLARPISQADAQIAAICKQHGRRLATRNIKDFCDLGLTLIDPWNLP